MPNELIKHPWEFHKKLIILNSTFLAQFCHLYLIFFFLLILVYTTYSSQLIILYNTKWKPIAEEANYVSWIYLCSKGIDFFLCLHFGQICFLTRNILTLFPFIAMATCYYVFNRFLSTYPGILSCNFLNKSFFYNTYPVLLLPEYFQLKQSR